MSWSMLVKRIRGSSFFLLKPGCCRFTLEDIGAAEACDPSVEVHVAGKPGRGVETGRLEREHVVLLRLAEVLVRGRGRRVEMLQLVESLLEVLVHALLRVVLLPHVPTVLPSRQRQTSRRRVHRKRSNRLHFRR